MDKKQIELEIKKLIEENPEFQLKVMAEEFQRLLVFDVEPKFLKD